MKQPPPKKSTTRQFIRRAMALLFLAVLALQTWTFRRYSKQGRTDRHRDDIHPAANAKERRMPVDPAKVAPST
eukprot:CAMPEP_0181127878 /NCGR_PEP_ID=MMETSP1071-20121207/28442_1 /TAXON_ID=35127 /ORGANISM="Thalassiosira sp., Strain NH16" /LENGTH=72 /DNA_ID=CAMNT_0023213665 /DNA_START=85 /DNA_END=299 /DNA_ORIENTATION=+